MFARRLVWLPVTALLVIVAAALWNLDKLSRIDAAADRMTASVLKLERAMGYVGFIHHFKNHVLRPGEMGYRDDALTKIDAALASVDVLDELAAELAIDISLTELRQTLRDYKAMVPQVQQARDRGASVREIDELVRISDAEASLDIEGIEAAILAQISVRRDQATLAFWLTSLMSLLLFLGAGVAYVLTERAAGRSARMLADVLAQADLRVLVSDAQGRVRFANDTFRAFMQRYGVDGPLDGQPIQALGKHLAPSIANYDDVAGGVSEAVFSETEYDVIMSDGAIFRLTANKMAHEGTLVIMRDVTERRAEERRVDDERQRLIGELTRSNRELSNFADAASHDLQEPLRGIALNANFLAREPLSERGHARLARMIEMCHKERRLIDDLLTIARVGAVTDGEGRSHETARTEDIVADLIGDFQETLEQCGGRITVETPLPDVALDAARLRSLFQNLIDNGLRYNRSPTPEVRIGFDPTRTVDGAPRRDVFYVRDNGIGIAPEQRARVWHVFARLGDSAEHGKGTGVGLAIVRRIAEYAGGWIRLDTDLDPAAKGSTFVFHIPLEDRQESRHPEARSGAHLPADP